MSFHLFFLRYQTDLHWVLAPRALPEFHLTWPNGTIKSVGFLVFHHPVLVISPAEMVVVL